MGKKQRGINTPAEDVHASRSAWKVVQGKGSCNCFMTDNYEVFHVKEKALKYIKGSLL